MGPHRNSAVCELNASALRPASLVEWVAGPELRRLPPVGRPSRRFSWRRLATAALGLATVASTAVAGFTVWDRTTTHSGGPVQVDSGIYGQRLAVGQTTVVRGITLRNTARQAATLEKVSIVGMTGGFDVVGVRADPAPTGAGAGTPAPVPRFPSAEGQPFTLAGAHVVPAATSGADGAADHGLQLVLGARATAPGVARMRGIEITYRVGPRRYRRTTDAAIYLCAPRQRFTAANCPGGAEGRFGNVVMDVAVAR